MRTFSISLLLGALCAFGAHAQQADSRTVAMPFEECLSIITEVSQEVDQEPVKLVSTDELTTVRINAEDGFVTVSCSRSDNQMRLSKSPVPRAAGITASR